MSTLYATQQNIIDRYGLSALLLVADPNNTGTPDATIVGQALSDASEEIDGAVSAKYTLPLPSPPPELLVRYCVDIALYRLSTSPGASLTDERRKRYEDVRADLKAIAKGETRLTSIPTPDSSNGAVTLIGGRRRFTRRSQEEID